jgi:hypothetical protein
MPIDRRPAPRWHDQRDLLLDLAAADLRAGAPVRPTLVAFAGDQPLFLATLRPFARGRHADAVVEVGALALGLRADRLALSLAGRAWSTEDPIPPVSADADLRQRVVVVHAVDAAGAEPSGTTTVVPYDVAADGAVALGPAVGDDAGQGWVPVALMAMARAAALPDDRPDADDELGAQVLRCERLGHVLAWSRQVRPRVDLLRLLPHCA